MQYQQEYSFVGAILGELFKLQYKKYYRLMGWELEELTIKIDSLYGVIFVGIHHTLAPYY
ncbi:hypothetical protein KCF3NO3_34120 [Chryseobacterium sp. KCF3-3]